MQEGKSIRLAIELAVLFGFSLGLIITWPVGPIFFVFGLLATFGINAIAGYPVVNLLFVFFALSCNFSVPYRSL